MFNYWKENCLFAPVMVLGCVIPEGAPEYQVVDISRDMGYLMMIDAVQEAKEAAG